jgi:hypothetical protein
MRKLKLFLVALCFVLSAGLVLSEIEPGAPTTITENRNWTVGGNGVGGVPTAVTNDRGFIYEVVIDESFQTSRWKAYVGNITGELKLGDGSNSLVTWTLGHVTGELYATRFNGTSGDTAQGATVGTIMWENVACASEAILINETAALHHNSSTDVDALNLTFTNITTLTNFEVAGNTIDLSGGCYGKLLNTNGGTTTAGLWEQVVLQDTGDSQNDDLFYAVMLEHNAAGFNGQTYDFQILLPDEGTETTSTSATYYFYIELLGNT